jgi:hypothetical protein
MKPIRSSLATDRFHFLAITAATNAEMPTGCDLCGHCRLMREQVFGPARAADPGLEPTTTTNDSRLQPRKGVSAHACSVRSDR